MQAAGVSDTGLTRNLNQDAILVCNEPLGPLPNLFIVADGMGGHKAGEIASKTSVETITKYITEFKGQEFVLQDNYLDLIVSAIQEANKNVYNMSESDPEKKGMGTTLIACTITKEKIIMAHVGDSRGYCLTNDKILQITADHTYVEEMVQAGQITAEQASQHPSRHVITRAVGTYGPLEVDGIVRPIEDTTAVLICSDGLSDMMNDDKIKEIVNSQGFVQDRAKQLIDEANSKGGHDNITAIIIDTVVRGDKS